MDFDGDDDGVIGTENVAEGGKDGKVAVRLNRVAKKATAERRKRMMIAVALGRDTAACISVTMSNDGPRSVRYGHIHAT